MGFIKQLCWYWQRWQMDDSLTFSFHFATSNAHKFVCWELSLNKFDQSIDRPRLSGSNTWWEEFEFIHKLLTFPHKPEGWRKVVLLFVFNLLKDSIYSLFQFIGLLSCANLWQICPCFQTHYHKWFTAQSQARWAGPSTHMDLGELAKLIL